MLLVISRGRKQVVAIPDGYCGETSLDLPALKWLRQGVGTKIPLEEAGPLRAWLMVNPPTEVLSPDEWLSQPHLGWGRWAIGLPGLAWKPWEGTALEVLGAVED